MARDWRPAVYPKPPAKGPYWVKFREWERRFERDPWSRRKGFRTRAEAQAVGDRKKEEWRRKEAGMWNEQVERARLPLVDYIDQFERHVHLGLVDRQRRRPSGYAKSPRQILAAAAKAASAKTIGDLTRDRVETWLASQRKTLRPKTINGYCAMLERFGDWLEVGDIVTRSPFRRLPRVPTDDHQHRQALDTDGVLRLAWAAVGRVQAKARGRSQVQALPRARRRALVAIVTYLTSLRGTALANLAWSWIDENRGCIRVPGEWVKRPKNPRPQFIPLHSELAVLLREIRRERAVAEGQPIGGDHLIVGERDPRGFARIPGATPRHLRLDAAFAGIEPVDPEGRRLDVTAMRTTLATELRRLGVPGAIVSEIMHTAKSTIADRHYIHGEDEKVLAELRGYLDRIPFRAEDVRGLLFDVAAESTGVRSPRAAPDPVRSDSHQLPPTQESDTRYAT